MDYLICMGIIGLVIIAAWVLIVLPDQNRRGGDDE